MNQLEKMPKNLILAPILGYLAQIWAAKKIFVGFPSTRCETLLQAIIVSNFKDTGTMAIENCRKMRC